MDNNALGKAIRKARGDLSLRDYAKKIGISHTHLDSIEKGYDPRTGKPVTISLDTFVKLSDATGIPLEELLFMLKYLYRPRYQRQDGQPPRLSKDDRGQRKASVSSRHCVPPRPLHPQPLRQRNL